MLPFHIVLREDDGRLTRHSNLTHAHEEAKRLAGKEGKKFFVLSTTASAQIVAPVEVTLIDHDLPF